MIKTPTKFIALLSGAAFLMSSAFAQGVTTDPVGYVTVTVEGGSKYNFISLPFVAATAAQGALSDSSATTLTASGAGFDEFAGYYVEITSAGTGLTGGGEGLTVDIVSNTADVLTLADDISSYSLEGDETFRILEHFTLNSVFGASGLLGGTSAGASDEILLWNPSAQAFQGHFYNSVLGQWNSSLAPFGGDTGATVLYPEQGAVIFRRGAGSIDVVVTGAVKTGVTQSGIFPGFNFYDNQKPSATTLTATGWQNDLTGGTSAGASDEVGIWNASAQTLTTYFYNSVLGQWNSSLAPFGGDTGATVIDPTDSILINRKSVAVVLSEPAIVIN